MGERDGYIEQVVSYTGDEGDVPALLLIPALKHLRAHGGHALTEERFDAILDWVITQLSENESIGG